MTNLKVTTEGDLDRSSKSFGIVSDSDQRKQRLETKIRHFLGDWFLNELSGFPWYEEVFIKSPVLSQIKRDFMDYILDIPGIESFLSDPVFEINTAIRRQLNISFEVLDEDSNILSINQVF